MNEIERELVEEYKRLDLLLKDRFNTETGVSEYISRMDKEAGASSIFSDWDRDYRKLKHIRHVRNKIMHDENDSFCEESDIDFADEFYYRVVDQNDPLSRLYRRREKPKSYSYEHKKETEEIFDFAGSDDLYEDGGPNRTTAVLLILLFITLGVLAAMIYVSTR